MQATNVWRVNLEVLLLVCAINLLTSQPQLVVCIKGSRRMTRVEGELRVPNTQAQAQTDTGTCTGTISHTFEEPRVERKGKHALILVEHAVKVDKFNLHVALECEPQFKVHLRGRRATERLGCAFRWLQALQQWRMRQRTGVSVLFKLFKLFSCCCCCCCCVHTYL